MRRNCHFFNDLTLAPLTLALAAVALMAAPQAARAAVNWEGDVRPVGTTFGVITIDEDNDFIADVLDDQGNNVFDFLVDPNDPDGGNGNGLAWDDPDVWVDYETTQNILVGYTGQGSLEINAGSALRYQHLVLGGATGENSELELGTLGDNDYEFQMDIVMAAQGGTSAPSSSGIGYMTITGAGSVFNNDYNVIPGEYQSALNFTAGDPLDTLVLTTPDVSERQQVENADGYDVHVGLLGRGVLTVNAGGRMEIQDALFLGLGVGANGKAFIDGSDTYVAAYGRDELDDDGVSTPATQLPSVIGGFGKGTLTITNGAMVEMFNGAGVGTWLTDAAGNPEVPQIANPQTVGEGVVEVTGPGSTWNVYVTSAPTGANAFTGNRTALAIGESPVSGDSDPGSLGTGRLTIGLGAEVNVLHNQNYENTQESNANMWVADKGVVTMSGGDLNVTNELVNLGEFSGYGDINAKYLFNGATGSAVGSIAASTQPGETLRIVVQDRVDGNSPRDDSTPTGSFYNLGDVSGNLSVDVVNGFYNDGSLRANGTITSGTFYNGSLGEVVVSADQHLRLIAADDDASPRLSTADAILFDSLDAILSDDEDGDGEIDGSRRDFFQANLGKIEVTGGEFETGNIQDAFPVVTTPLEQKFWNARVVELDSSVDPVAKVGEVVGVITGRDATLRFESGLYNTGVMQLVSGDNIISGDVMNAGYDYDSDADPVVDVLVQEGVILVTGNETTATFQDNVMNGPDAVFAIGPNNVSVTIDGDFQNQGELQFISESPSTLTTSSFYVAGDADVGGTLFFSFATGETAAPGFATSLLSAGGDLSEDSFFTGFDLPALAVGDFWEVTYDYGLDQILLGVVSAPSAIGGDFDGNGIVDDADIAIWSMNVGILSGASIIQGDADLDGDVDLDDFAVIIAQFGGAPTMVSLAAAVPEPASCLLALLAACGLIGRRRR
ncbi:hypothetical protein Mal64_21630 [Pseudobythopirellula maris]|uniref:Dockerin domain-containing protein n=1 Tax=Pseudobythopirellula maris TaxID=2527991 RepID=A0A5C5ZNI2_9BACT|nr:hypothetical protein [Pseudobythopirellula maris]TWT88676.1 hypothetical protein Mal64_21630 [Pseudobythopirellula maris]